MINKMLKRGFKLPHTSPLKVKKLVEEKLPEFDRTPKKLNIQEPIPIKMEAPFNIGHTGVNPFAPKNDDKVPSNEDVVSSSGGDNTIDYSNMTPEQKSSLEDFWKTEIENYGGIEPGSEGYAELVGANRYAVYDRGRFRPDGQGGGTYQFDKPQWRLKGGGPEYDNPKGIHPDQLMRMYQGDNNKYE
jgi:hypothetical protein